MYNPPKPKYSAPKLYDSDINDLVEEDMNKGGLGSGIRGHKTIRDRQMGIRYKVISEDKTHYHAEDHRGNKVSINRTQADEEKESPAKLGPKFDINDPKHKPGTPEHKKFHEDAKRMNAHKRNVRAHKQQK